MKRIIFIIGVLFVVVFIGGCVGGASSDVKTSYVPVPSYYPVSSYVPTSLPAPVVQNFSGHGQHASEKFQLNSGLTVFMMKHGGESNFAIWLLDDKGVKKELLVNEIGVFDGSKAVGVSGGVYVLDVKADGDWTVVVKQ